MEYSDENKEKQTRIIMIAINVAIIIVALALAVTGYFVLPAEVITQLSAGGNSTKLPKFIALLIPLALSVGGAVFGLMIKETGKSRTSALVFALAGILLNIIMFAVNLS